MDPTFQPGQKIKSKKHQLPSNLFGQPATVEEVLFSGSWGIQCDRGVLKIRLASGTVIYQAADLWEPASNQGESLP